MVKKKKENNKYLSKEKKELNAIENFIFETSYRLSPKGNLKTPIDKRKHKELFMTSLKESYLKKLEDKRISKMEKRVMKNKHTRKNMEKFNELFPPPPQTKDINKMNSQEFYEYILNHQTANESFLDFLFDYITTAYLEGALSSQDIANIVKAPSALEIKNYIDNRLSDLKYKYSLAEEILNYSGKSQGSELLKELLPNQIENKEKNNKENYKIKTIKNLKRLLKTNFPDMENMKKEMEKVKMIRAEKDRIVKQRKIILANSPEALDLVKKKDGYASEKNQKTVTKNFINQESKNEEQKKVILRKVKKPMTPSELIAEKKRVMQKLNSQQQSKSSGLNLKT